MAIKVSVATMRMNIVGKTAAAASLLLALIAAPMQAMADDGSNTGSSESQASDTNYSWNGGQPAPDVFNARPQSGGVWATGTTPTGGTAPLTYHGGIAATGSTTKYGVSEGAPLVYLVFWGSQWGTDTLISVDTRTVHSFSGDVTGMSRYLQDFVAGIGTAGDNWSGVFTEYCDQLATGATTCGSQDTRNRVGLPAGSVLAGTWYDNSTNTSDATSATSASQAALAGEAVKAANYFGNNAQSKNLNTQYVIVSPSGLHPNGFNYSTTGWCAWHSMANSTTTGNVAYTNLPYMPDMGASCGQNSVNAGAAGKFDGVSIVEGHEYAETLTDLWAGGGYYDATGWENGDKCSWMSTADPRNGGNITTTTGTFAMQGTWSNQDGWCSMGAPLGATTVTLNGTSGGAISGRIVTGGARPYSYVANTPLPAGLELANDGRIITTGVVAQGVYQYSYTVTDANNNTVIAASAVSIAPSIPTTTSLVVSATSVTATTSVTMTATVSPVLSAATVSFYDGATLLGTAKTNTSGVATLAKTFAAGTHSVTATLTAPTGYSGSTSSAVSIVSQAVATTTALTTNATASTTTTTSVTLTGKVYVAGTTTLLSGASVSFYDGGVLLGTATTSTSGSATLAKTFASAGAHSLTAVFNGSATYATSTSPAVSINANLTATTLKLTSSTSTTRVGTSVTLTTTLSVKAAVTVVITSTVNGVSTTLGTVTTSASTGVATLSTKWAAAGSYTVTATFSGTTTYSGSTASLTETIKP